MINRHFSRAATLVALLLFAMRAPAAVITSDLTLSPLDTSYDGTDLVISNCTVTMDGAHSFNSLLVAGDGVVTHSFLPSGSTTLFFNVTDEPQTLNGTNPATLIHANVSSITSVTDSGQTITYTNDVDFVQTNLADGTTQIYRTDASSIPDGTTVLVTYTWAYSYNAGLVVSVTNDFTLANGASLNANGIGYGGNSGVGHGFSSVTAFPDGSGAGHGGSGGMSSSNAIGGNCYGSLYQPTAMGSGGGSSYAGAGGNGGGKIQITAGGSVTIDGSISANGANATNSRAGGGAGGGIWITATNVTGSGSLTANGGAGEPNRGGGGGGGRISIQCGTNQFAGTMTAYGGSGWKTGGAGTIFTQAGGLTGLLLVDNGGRVGTNSSFALTTLADVIISGGAGAKPLAFNSHNLTIGTNSTLTGFAQSSLTLSVSGNLIIQPGGALTMDSLGYAAGSGTSPGHAYTGGNYYPASGGGHGGNGGLGSITNSTAAGSGYGSQTAPTTFGSGGGNGNSSIGGAGGGALQLNVAGSLQMDGTISANGGNGSGTGGGGGAGGSISIKCGPLSGSGTIAANGGDGVALLGGGGGGGRIAVISTTNSFAGNLSAAGGGGINYGGAGTIYLQSFGMPKLILDNAGHFGAGTPVQSASSTSLTVQNGAVGTVGTAVTFASLLVTSNAWLTTPGPSTPGSFTINGNATFQAGGGFLADGGGSLPGQGNGPGGYFYTGNNVYVCGGGGHGGSGGNAVNNLATGGQGGYDNAITPSTSTYAASGGGTFSPYSIGGSGGGVVQMTVNGTLLLDGLITANGINGSGQGGGGGSGGTVYLTAGTFAGNGTITANGGNGADSVGGGGGGGRIAIYFSDKTFSGNLSAIGGGGANYGGAGTIYFRTNNSQRGQIIVDNAGHSGAGTPTASLPTTDVTFRNGGNTYVSGNASYGNLTIGSNAWLVVSNQFNSPSVATINAFNLTIQSGGGLTADASGYNAGTGSGPGSSSGASLPYYACGGAGHGGYGASSVSNSIYTSGGTSYDTASGPTLAGSGGGSFQSYSFGGKGGGAIQLTLGGTLQVDGTLSANGGNGSGNGGGGGAGGSVNVTCFAFTGSGSIAANGGNGVNAVGGGGAGGMIYVNATSNLFSGGLSAYGGGGANYGGAGTIYLRSYNNGQITTLIVDNAGHRGTNTPLPIANNYILRNGASGVQAFPPQTISSLLITSNAWLLGNNAPGNNYPGIVNLTVNGNATIQSGGGISTDASGSVQNSGTGRGTGFSASPYYPCSGAGHGGYGAYGISNSPAGGTGGATFDSTTSPSSVGSGGGGSSLFSTGGSGGGFVQLIVNGTLQLDGSISANGGNGSGSGGGGGSGGSIYLAPAALTGSGTISANGGNGVSLIGGGGGGGRIAIFINGRTNSLTGTVSAYGGGGANYGGAGTIYYGSYFTNSPLLVLDNANNRGTNTTFDLLSMNVLIQRKAVGQLPAAFSWSAQNITIRTNGTLTAVPYANSRTITAKNLTIDAGGALTLDGAGYGAQLGAGSGYGLASGIRGGGGHGGYGGGNPSGYGKAYDSIQTPTTAGSGGGNYQAPPYNQGGSGGGALALNVNGTLTVNGRLSANGGNGDYNAGGGAGGSLNLTFINLLTGNGIISANGGSTTGSAGSGSGGRIYVNSLSNNFTGQLSAFGGNGLLAGGAGTVYTRINNLKTLLVDNGGLSGTNTPLGTSFTMPPAPFDLNISGAATVVAASSLPIINNLNLAAGSTLTMPVAQSNLFLVVQKNANLAGSVTVDNLGFAQSGGPGAGTNITSKGSGGGYGGTGGNSSSSAPGGTSYGSASQPVDFGSGGGSGFNNLAGGSEGGGALRISVGGVLNVDGNVSANGDFGWQDDSGGGSGGGIWITANTLTGLGNISANGGNGESAGGGGGSGGRIAIYSPTNLFLGSTNVTGGGGFSLGQAGTIFLSSTPGAFQILSESPSGTVMNTVSYVDLYFNEAVDPASVTAANITVTTPAGVLDSAAVGVAAIDATITRVSFPVQNLLGDYSVQVAGGFTSILGQPLAQGFTGNFTITLPTISGTVKDTNGAPVAGVLVQPDGGLIGAVTDTNGFYSIGVPPGWEGIFTPSFGTNMFVPGSAAYANVTASITNQNFLMVPTVAPTLTSSFTSTNLTLAWQGIPGVTYSVVYSADLVNWTAYGGSGLFLLGTNGPMQVTLPIDSSPELFFCLKVFH